MTTERDPPFTPPAPPPLDAVMAQARKTQPNTTPSTEDDMTGFWDDPDVKQASAWFKFEKAGDRVEGEIAKLGKKVWQDGGIGIEILFADDETPALTASQVLLKQALFELKPAVGDTIGIEWRPSRSATATRRSRSSRST